MQKAELAHYIAVVSFGNTDISISDNLALQDVIQDVLFPVLSSVLPLVIQQ